MSFSPESAFAEVAAVRVWFETRVVSAFGIYEDYPSGARVYELCRSLAAYLGPRCRVHRAAWPSAELRSATARTEAAREADKANLIIVSARRGEDVSIELEQWFELWPATRPTKPTVLCGIFDSPPGLASPLQEHLDLLARKRHLQLMLLTAERAALTSESVKPANGQRHS